MHWAMSRISSELSTPSLFPSKILKQTEKEGEENLQLIDFVYSVSVRHCGDPGLFAI
jgi:hypothetical protein